MNSVKKAVCLLRCFETEAIGMKQRRLYKIDLMRVVAAAAALRLGDRPVYDLWRTRGGGRYLNKNCRRNEG